MALFKLLLGYFDFKKVADTTRMSEVLVYGELVQAYSARSTTL